MTTPINSRQLIDSWVLEPGTGKAIELLRGQILRIEQIEGSQCVDFNCFNLHDYKEYMHTGRTRTLYGINPTKGHFMWSAPPRERPMAYILEDTAGCNDVMFPRCSAYLYESVYGFHTHTNCHDIQSEAQREYGLTPDDVHDSFNLFMKTGVDANGRMWIDRQSSVPGDYIEFLAIMDLLAVPNVCGADIMKTSNFAIRPVKLSIYTATEEEMAAVPSFAPLPSQRTPADFRQPKIKADRALQKDPAYKAEFANTPILYEDFAVALSAEDYALFKSVADPRYGADEGAALRDIVFTWWHERFLGK